MDPAVCWGLATGSHQHHKQCLLSLSIGGKYPLVCRIHPWIDLTSMSPKSFDPDTVPLKWDPVQLLHGHVVLYQDASDSGNAYSIYVIEYLPICKYLLLYLVETNCIVCSDYVHNGKFLLLGEQALASTPSRSSSHSVEKCNDKLLLVCFFFTVLYIPYTVLKHLNTLSWYVSQNYHFCSKRNISHPAIQYM